MKYNKKIPQPKWKWHLLKVTYNFKAKKTATFVVGILKLEEVEGFEPPRGVTRLSVFKTDPFSQTWVYLHVVLLHCLIDKI